MKITFQTKEQSNAAQQKEFLALNPGERFYKFLWLSERLNMLTLKKIEKKKNNFEIIIKVNAS